MNNLRRLAGLDVHKDSIFCCVKQGKYQSEVKQFSTTTEGLEELHHFLHGELVQKVAMESTGIYWMPVWRALETDFELLLVNPYFIKQMPGRKTDVQDAQWIATLLDKKLLKGSIVPEKEVRIIRGYLRRYTQLQGQLTRVLQQIEKQLSQCNIKICSLSSTIGSKTVLEVVRSIILGKHTSEDLYPLIHGRIVNRHGKDKVLASLQGIIEGQDVFLLTQIMQQYDLFQQQCTELLAQAEQMADRSYKQQLDKLQTIPGISKLSAVTIFVELGGNIHLFQKPENLVGWCGLRPKNEESAGKIKSRAVGKGNKYLRRVLVQVAWAATRTKECFLKEKFEKLIIRKSRKKALVAVARKQLVYCWQVLAKEEDYKSPFQKKNPQKLQNQFIYYQHKLNKIIAEKQSLDKVG